MPFKRLVWCTLVALVVTVFATQPGWAVPASYVLPPDDVGVVGEAGTDIVPPGQSLLDVARAHGLGFNEITNANPGVYFLSPPPYTQVVLPTRHVLPDAPREGIVVNLPEMRLYYYPKPKKGEAPMVITYPVSVGRMDWNTPLGLTSVAAKVVHPTWTPPPSIRREHAAKGDILPAVVPAGEANPLGLYALRLGIKGYLIHGVDVGVGRDWGIGMRVTHGCMRLYPEDIEVLFKDVPVGTPVRLINQPFKLGWLAGVLYLQVFPPMDEERGKVIEENALIKLIHKAVEGKTHYSLDTDAIKRATNEIRLTDSEELHGIPVPVPIVTEIQP